MNYNKIGLFLTSLRKEKNLTQAKLAEMLFVSEKTVSKWENGKSIPDTTILPKLCEIFGVTLNELLCGEKNSAEKNSEQILFNLAKELEQKNKLIKTSMWFLMIVSIVALLGGIIVAGLFMPEGVWQLVVILGITILFLIPCFFALKLEVSVGAYKCKNCGTEITPTYSEVLNAMHMGTTRYLKCPNCGKRTWCKKIWNKKN